MAAFFRRHSTRFVDYCKLMGKDYAMVGKDTVKGCKEKPLKAAVIFSGLGGLVYAYRTNPSFEDMMNELREKRQQMVLIPNSEHNPAADRELANRSLLLSQHRLHYYNLWIFSLLLKTTHDDRVRLFSSQDRSLRPWIWQEFWENIIDVGVLGRWYHLHNSFVEHDLNHEELDQLPA